MGLPYLTLKNKTVKEPAVLFARKRDSLDYQTLDGEDTFVFFAIAAPDGENNLHVDTLAELSKMIMKAGFVDDLKNIKALRMYMVLLINILIINIRKY